MSRKTRTIREEYVHQVRGRIKQEKSAFKRIFPRIAAFFSAQSLRRRLTKSSRSSKRARTRRVSSR